MKNDINDEKQTVRISGRCKLSQEAADTLENSKNKSAFLADAINFYVSFGKTIVDQLNTIDRKIDAFQNLKEVIENPVGVAGNVDIVKQTVTQRENVENLIVYEVEPKSVSEEEYSQKEQIYKLLNVFLNYSTTKGGE